MVRVLYIGAVSVDYRGGDAYAQLRCVLTQDI